jgi:cobyrinic acid a,c-diamide synthase
MSAPGLMVAATRSGAGKTTLTMGLLRAFRRRGLKVNSAKCGPDYIDPGMHTLATARASVNLDSWAMRPRLLDELRTELERDAELLLCEGVMGLFDGREASAEERAACADGSSASIAARTGWPVVLIADVSGQAQSVAAVVKGFATFRADVAVAGVILNRVASARHLASCRRAIEETGIALLGALPVEAALRMPERHLGLVQASETERPEELLDALAAFVERHVDLDALLRLARPSRVPQLDAALATPAIAPPGQRIALAQDRAFSFVYPHLLSAWRKGGAEIFPFSPLADQAPDARADVCWLPGGYPELHAGRLAESQKFKRALSEFARTRPVHGECGGYMVLGESLVDAQGSEHAMLGLLGHRTSFAQRKLSLGYREARLAANTVLGPAGSWLRGHEFHYATLLPGARTDAPLFDRALGTTEACFGTRHERVSGSFFHFLDLVDARASAREPDVDARASAREPDVDAPSTRAEG